MAESDLGSFAVAPEGSLAPADDEDTDLDRPIVTRSEAYNNWSGDDPVGALFKEMARYPLLNAAEDAAHHVLHARVHARCVLAAWGYNGALWLLTDSLSGRILRVAPAAK